VNKKILNEGKYSILYGVFVRTFVIPFYYGSETVISSDFLTSYGSGSGSAQQTVTVPVPQHCAYMTLMKLQADVVRHNMTNIRSQGAVEI
jgi:hypothetical protein